MRNRETRCSSATIYRSWVTISKLHRLNLDGESSKLREVGDSLADYRLRMVGERLKLVEGDTVSQHYPPNLELCSLGNGGWGNSEVGRRR